MAGKVTIPGHQGSHALVFSDGSISAALRLYQAQSPNLMMELGERNYKVYTDFLFSTFFTHFQLYKYVMSQPRKENIPQVCDVTAMTGEHSAGVTYALLTFVETGHVLLGKSGHVLLGKSGHVLLGKTGHVLLGKSGDVLLGKSGHVLLGKTGHVLLGKSGDVL